MLRLKQCFLKLAKWKMICKVWNNNVSKTKEIFHSLYIQGIENFPLLLLLRRMSKDINNIATINLLDPLLFLITQTVCLYSEEVYQIPHLIWIILFNLHEIHETDWYFTILRLKMPRVKFFSKTIKDLHTEDPLISICNLLKAWTSSQ